MIQASIPAEVRDRIITAAVELYEQSSRDTFPTVDQVRRLARADMNTTSAIMREWRRQQAVQAAPVAVAVPEAVAQANTVALAALWQQAQELANESLRSAQTAWETERSELDTIRQELADAYETQAAELEQVKASAEEAEQAYQVQLNQAKDELTAMQKELAKAITRAERAEAKVVEIEHRAADLRIELDRAHQDADHVRISLVEQQQATQAVTGQLDQVRSELAKVSAKADAEREAHQEQRKQAAKEINHSAEKLTRIEAERDSARKGESAAREEAAALRGRVEALEKVLAKSA